MLIAILSGAVQVARRNGDVRISAKRLPLADAVRRFKSGAPEMQ
jgi:hypothetical protein